MDRSPDRYRFPSSTSGTDAAPVRTTPVYQDPSSAPPPTVQAPIPQNGQPRNGLPPGSAPTLGAWTTGLCGCCQDCASCFVGHWCPCVLVGKNVEAIDEGRTSCATGGMIFFLLQFTGVCCVYTCLYRKSLRETYGIPGGPVEDFCTDCWCLCCSICQVYRELEHRHALNPGEL
ncbi:hypothetical protein R1sor_011394 [Riccia sorocarpa]|uniref:Uncharacterized protein n=1 Tax=Riccia sorocarpa TaxID=122646 RepID=A0ABD3I0T1_9MARC